MPVGSGRLGASWEKAHGHVNVQHHHREHGIGRALGWPEPDDERVVIVVDQLGGAGDELPQTRAHFRAAAAAAGAYFARNR